MFNPKDLTISLRAVTKPQHILNGGPEGATFPGWFLTAQENEGYVVIAGPVQLTPDEVTVITDVIETQAARIPDLKRRLGIDG